MVPRCAAKPSRRFSEVPYDVISQIFDVADSDTLKTVALLDQDHYDLVKPHLWRSITIHIDDVLEGPLARQKLVDGITFATDPCRATAVRKLSIQVHPDLGACSDFVECVEAAEDCIERAIRALQVTTNLRFFYLHVPWSEEHRWKQALGRVPSFAPSLTSFHTSMDVCDQITPFFATHSMSLQNLAVFLPHYRPGLLRPLMSLQHISLGSLESVCSVDSLIDDLCHMPNLRALSVGLQASTLSTFRQIITKLPAITRVNLHFERCRPPAFQTIRAAIEWLSTSLALPTTLDALEFTAHKWTALEQMYVREAMVEHCRRECITVEF